jgi:hypothetical protein
MHAPIEAPQHYVNSPQCSTVTTVNKRKTFCGMMVALDEGIANVTAACVNMRSHAILDPLRRTARSTQHTAQRTLQSAKHIK